MGTCSCVTRPPSLLLFSCLLVLLLFASLSARPTSAAPILLPNLQQCENATDMSVGPPPIMTLVLNCCLPIPPGDVIDFSFDRYQSRSRVRQAAHRVSEDYIATYTRAYELMKALPDDDPRGFTVQQKIHCAFCNGAYRQTGSESVPLQVHFSWLFLPWHRWYLYFHERILQSLLGDDSFSLVFWNWDDQRDGGNVMPAMFVPPGTALYDSKRNQDNLPPALVKLQANMTSNDSSAIVNQNLNNMYQQVVTATTAELFMGGAYRTGTDLTNATVLNAPLGGSLENGVHNGVHFWTGDPTQPLRQDMATFTTAAKDPIFYAHHSNVDRLWVKWNSGLPGGSRSDHSDPDFLNAEFYFYDETGSLVRVTVNDALDSSKLGVSYPDVAADDLWVNYSPPVTTSGSAVTDARKRGALDIAPWPQNNGTFPLASRLVAIVKTPTTAPPAASSAKVLVIQGLQLTRSNFDSILAFVNLPSADASTPTNSAEYLGAYNIIPSIERDRQLTANVKFEIGENLQRIGLQNEKEVVITLTTWGSEQVTIQGLLIDYE